MLKKLNTRHKRIIQMIIEHPDWNQNRLAKECGYCHQKLSEIVNDPLFKQALDDEYKIYWNDAFREAKEQMITLMRNGDYKATEFICKTCGLNPADRIEANLSGDIVITIDDKA